MQYILFILIFSTSILTSISSQTTLEQHIIDIIENRIRSHLPDSSIVKSDTLTNIKLYPTPSQNWAIVSFNSSENIEIKLIIIDLNMNVVLQHKMNVIRGKNIKYMDVSRLLNGNYILIIDAYSHKYSKKLIIQ